MRRKKFLWKREEGKKKLTQLMRKVREVKMDGIFF